MHRLQAGVPDATGWYLAQSTNGGFSVELPAPFNDFDIVPDGKEDARIAAQAIGTLTANGIKFGAVRFPLGNGETTLSQSREGVRALGNSVIDREVTYRGHPGFELHIASEAAYFAMTVYDIPPYRYSLSVEIPTDVTVDHATVERFFRSFHVGDDAN